MKSYHILKLKVFHVKSNNISPFVEFSVYTFFKLNNVRILYFLVSFATNPNSTCKIHFFSKTSSCSVKEAVILFLLWSALFRKFSRSRILLLEVALQLLTQISFEKLIYFENSWCFVKELVILILHTAFQKCNALISVFFFWFAITYRYCSCFFREFWVLHQRRSNTAPFVDQSVYRIFKVS